MKIIVVCGTRPDAIKLAPIYKTLAAVLPRQSLLLLSSGQHRELLAQALAEFDLVPDIDLAVMRPGQDLARLSARIVTGVTEVLERERPTLVITHGDTTTAFSAALASFYRGIPVAHVEAGLRSFALDSPFPEEAHRRFIATIAAMHFAPTELERRNLLAEGVPADRIHVTGNTMIDALTSAIARTSPGADASMQRLVLTMHRRERDTQQTRALLETLRGYLDAHPTLALTCPLHLQPATRDELTTVFADHPRVCLAPPLGYSDFIGLLRASACVLTDSGGVQEEAAFLRKPVVLLRERTERRDGLATGRVRLVGNDPTILPFVLDEMLAAPREPLPTAIASESPSRRIVQLILERQAA
ncbi:MAG: non-hydrolyzing UDP-N-acetylglucosamine 2-epimerase [Myxococcota bacterium]|nr:UDP-N-acetylglucosamine 2-epimerase (non-hydrolyzing) [Myxococcota bacterium]